MTKKQDYFQSGFNVEDNKLVDSYYDLLASEARQTSLVAIAKKDISPKHWNSLSRTLTVLNKYKGLVSWSGTAFEYLMPTINIPNYKGSIIDESCKFLIMSQIEYSKRLDVPWGFSEAAFNLKDLYNNYQYKAFGIPWLGLKRGLADEIVISSYGTILAISETPILVINNIKELQKNGMYSKYGLYESIDYTPARVKEKYEVVKTYMAHHQGLILLSLNNFFNDKILQKRFMQNPEMQAVKILLEERMPDNIIITKEEKEKIEKIKNIDYEDYNQRVYNKIQESLNIANVISNDKYKIVMDQYGNGYSSFGDVQINRYKYTDDEEQGILFFIKDVKNKRIWTNTYSKYMSKPDKYEVDFFPDKSRISRIDGAMKTVTDIITSTDEPIEIRRIQLLNTGMSEQMLELTSYLEPILSNKMQDYAHKAFNNLFLTYEYISSLDTILVKRKSTNNSNNEVFLAVKMLVEDEEYQETEYEIDKEKFWGRCNINLPICVSNSIPLSSRIENVTDPVIALKKIINIHPEGSAYVDLIIASGNTKEEVLNYIEKFSASEKVTRCFELSKARIETETRYLGLRGEDIETFQRMLAYLIFPYKYRDKKLRENRIYDITELWKYGISGDLPILLVEIDNVNDIDIVKETINAYEYYRTKKINLDLIILNKEKEKYENYVKEAIHLAILNKNLGHLLDQKGGIYCLNSIIDIKDMELIETKANLTIYASEGCLKEQINELEQKIKECTNRIGYDEKNECVYIDSDKSEKLSYFNEKELEYFNEYGGFSKDGKEYIIRVNSDSKVPSVWSHIMANEEFGTIVTESMGGYTWADNSRLNRITAWSNNRVADIPSEVIYFKEMETGKKWSMGFNPMPDENDYYAIYGFGYARFFHNSDGLEQNLTVFVPQKDRVKVNLLKIINRKPVARKLKLIYYIKPVLGEDEIITNGNIDMKFYRKSNMIVLNNLTEKNGRIYITSSEKIESYTGNRNSFLYNSNISNPDGLEQLELNRDNSYGKDGIVAIEMNVRVEAMDEKEIAITLGSEKIINHSEEIKDESEVQDMSYKYSNLANCKTELMKVQRYWSDMVNKVQINTPSESMNILLNGWLIYQTIEARLYARSGYYQSGGAFGFRDQLQDSLAIKFFDARMMKDQIIKHSRHQFVEGDVEHWWHDMTNRGIRTKFSDDLLWLSYVTANYIEFTNDYSILDVITPYIQGENLKDGENERYDLYLESNIEGSIYEHCIKAIDKALKFGENGLPLIGSGDWNDGFSNVGINGKGESVWLGFFLYDVLKQFIPICQYREDKNRVEKYTHEMEKLKRNLNTKGWDGRWFKRAFTDNGDTLGSLQNEECRIDNISQSWAVISGAGDNDKKYISMESLENHLIDKTNGIIKLLDPPFDKSKLEPGYIKAYIPGTRENGGQYTHECCC